MIRDKTVDQAIVDPKVYASEQDYHALFARLRRDDPVHWTEPTGFESFWAVTKHDDVNEIERQNTKFLNAPRLNMRSDEVEANLRARLGRKTPFRMIVNMDEPDHRKYRALTQAWFLPANLRKLEVQTAALAVEYVDRMAALGGSCDFVKDVAVWYPLRVIMMILGLAREDENLVLRLTQQSFGAEDPDVGSQDDAHGASALRLNPFATGPQPSKAAPNAAEIRSNAMAEFLAYCRGIMVDRRRSPRDDLATLLATAVIDGEPIGDLEVISYYLVITTAGHDTTSSSIAGGLLALIQNPGELRKLQAEPGLLHGAVEEMIRWVTPVKHFLRTAAEDYELRGRKIRAGQRLMMCYPSANRDEEVFEDPFSFRVSRTPNKHLAFGIGVHQCLGLHLARLEMRAFFTELLSRLDHIELAGNPETVAATFISGLKRMPVKYKLRNSATVAGNVHAAQS